MINQLTDNRAKLIPAILMLVIGAAVLITGILANKNKVASASDQNQHPARLKVLTERLNAVEEYKKTGTTTHTYHVEGVIYPPGSKDTVDE